jgi:hypothetical protein
VGSHSLSLHSSLLPPRCPCLLHRFRHFLAVRRILDKRCLFLRLAGADLGVAAAGTVAAGATGAAFAALIAAQRFFVPAIVARLPAALIFRFAGAVGPTLAGGFESGSTDGSTAFRPGPGVFSVVVGP